MYLDQLWLAYPTNDLFMGMMNYLSPYIPKFADEAHNLKGLLRNDSQWICNTDYQKCFEELKSTVTVDACLKYYNLTTTLTLEVHALQRSIGVPLVQDNRPIAFGSKTLTECQSRYSNIEREMLAIVYDIQRYHTYLYGKLFIVAATNADQNVGIQLQHRLSPWKPNDSLRHSQPLAQLRKMKTLNWMNV